MVTKRTKSEFQNDLLWRRWIEAVENVLHKTIAWRFKWVLWGMLFAVGRKTISSWIRAAEVQEEYQRYYYAVSAFGRQAQKISEVTLGETDAKLCYGHSWVSISWTARHPEHGTVAFPLRGLLYVRKKEISKVQTRYPDDNWEFKTKTSGLKLSPVCVAMRCCTIFRRRKPKSVAVGSGFMASIVCR